MSAAQLAQCMPVMVRVVCSEAMELRGMNVVLWVECLDFLCPLFHIQIFVVVECHVLRLKIDIDTLNGRKFRAHIFDERRARSAVDAGDGNGCGHKKKRM